MKWYTRTVVGLGIAVFALTAFEYSLYEMMQVGTCASGGPYVSARECPSGIEIYFAGLFGGIIFGLIGTAIYGMRGPAPGTADDDSGLGGSAMRAGGTGLSAWGAFFTVTGLVALYAAFGADNPGPGAKTGGAIVGVVFLLMGVPAVIGVIGGALGRGRRSRPGPALAPMTPTGANPAPSSTIIEGLGSFSGGGSAATPAAPTEPVWPTPNAPAKPIPSIFPTLSAPAAAKPGGGDALARLEKLAKLKDSGALSQVEFDAAKAKILAEM